MPTRSRLPNREPSPLMPSAALRPWPSAFILQAKIAALKEEVAALEKENDWLCEKVEEVEDLHEEKAALQARIAALEAEKAALQAKIAALEVEELRETVKKLKRDNHQQEVANEHLQVCNQKL